MQYNLSIDHDLKLKIVENMQIYGGSFVQALAKCILQADHVNLVKIQNAFEHYIEEYHPDKWADRSKGE